MDWNLIRQHVANTTTEERLKKKQEVSAEDVEAFVENYGKVSSGVANSAGSNSYVSSAERTANANALEALERRRKRAQEYLEKKSGDYKNGDELLSAITDSANDIEVLKRTNTAVNDYWNQWSSESDYNDYLDYVKEQERLEHLNIKEARDKKYALEQEIAVLRRGNGTVDIVSSALSHSGNTVDHNAINRIKELQQEVDALGRDIALASRIQTNKYLTNSAVNSQDFDKYSVEPVIPEEEKTYNVHKQANQKREDSAVKYMSEDQRAIYNYYYNRVGEAKAEEYLDSIRDDLSQKQAEAIFAGNEDNILYEYIMGAQVGLEQAKSGFQGNIRMLLGDDEYQPLTTYDYLDARIKEDLADKGFKFPEWMGGQSIGQVGYDYIKTYANMAPSILLGAVTGTGALAFGASAAGNAYNEKIREGYSKDQAAVYSSIIGTSEAMLQKVLGSVGFGGKTVASKAFEKVLPKVDSAAARVALNYGQKALSEGIEESLQEYLEPIYRNIAFGETNEAEITPEVIYAGILGALMGAGEGHSYLASEIKAGRENSRINDKYGESIGQIVSEGLSMPKDSEAYELAREAKNKLNAGEELSDEELDGIVEATKAGAETGQVKPISKENPVIIQERKAPAKAEPVAEKAEEAPAATDVESLAREAVSGPSARATSRRFDSVLSQIDKRELSKDSIEKLAKDFPNANKNTPKQISEMYDSGDGLSAESFFKGIEEAYKYGSMSYPIKDMETDAVFAKELPSEKRLKAYYMGENNAKNANIAKAKETQSRVLPGVKGKVIFESGAATQVRNNLQKATINVIDKVLKNATNIEYHVFASYVYKGEAFSYKTADGKTVEIRPGMRVYNNGGKIVKAPNGYYIPGKHQIWVDINAGSKGLGTMLYTITHEHLHDIKIWSPEHYNKLVNIVSQAYERGGKSFAEAVDSKYASYKNSHSETTYEDAQEEVIAEAMSGLLRDENGLRELSIEIQKQDKTLWEKIKNWFADVIARITNAYKEVEPESEEAKILMEQKELFEQAQKVFAEAVVTAGQNYKNAGVEIDAATESVAPSDTMFSERTWSESEYVKARNETARAIASELDVSLDKAYDYIDSINSVAKAIADDRARLDYDPNLDEHATVLKPNSEYGVTVDMSTLCAKRLLFTGTFDAIQRKLSNTVFDSEDIVKLREMMMDRGYEVACGICYVESTRRELGPITQEFINKYVESQKTGKPIQRKNSKGKLVDLKKTKEQMNTTADKSTDKFIADKNYTPTLADLNTTDIDFVKRDHPLVYEAYLNFMNARGQSKPKLLETRAEYKGEILKHFKQKKTVDKKNREGGLRLQSFSDFELPHLIDMMQIVMDMSRVGLKSQAYTKVPKFAEAFGGTGVKINLSLIAKGSGLDANGNLIFDDVEGIDHNEAFRIREKFSKNVGTILVGKNDAHIIAAMADPRIDMIIPFHKSSWKESLYEALGLTGYENYTEWQHERDALTGENVKHDFYSGEYWDDSKTGDENAQIYLQKCRNEGRIPVFPQFQNYPGYWKLLIDFKMYDNDGVRAPQEVVKPIFDNEYNAKILEEYKGGHRKLPVAQDVVDDFVKEYDTGIKHQDRDFTPAPTFYSNMGRVVDGIKNNKIAANSVVSYLKGKGVKAEELKWSGIETFLEGKKSVTKQELKEFVDGSMLQIGEVIKEDVNWKPVVKKTSPRTRALYNNGELIETFTQHPRGDWMPDHGAEGEVYAFGDENLADEYKKYHDEGIGTRWYDYKLDGGKNYREFLFKLPNSNFTNKSMRGHWGWNAKGIFAHARVQDFKVGGKKMLFIEEIQSDWHNEGQKQGYVNKDLRTEKVIRNESADAFHNFVNSDVMQSIESRLQLEGYEDTARLFEEIFDGQQFALDTVVENIGSLSSTEKAFIQKAVAAEKARQKELLTAPSPEGIEDAPFRNNYHEFVLKRLIREAAEKGYDSIGWTTADIQSDRWSDEFAEGYRIEYDQDIPKFLNKYGKKWGAQVGKTTIRHGLKGTEVWSMPVTEAMKNSVLTEGQVMYSDRDSDGGELSKEQAEFFKDSKVRDEDGNLLVMYHGSENDFTEFDKNRMGKNAGSAYGFGFYFTESLEGKGLASAYAYGDKVLKGYVNIKKPLSTTKKTISKEAYLEIGRKLKERHNSFGYPFYFSEIYDDARSDFELYAQINSRHPDIVNRTEDSKFIQNEFMNLGFDGAIRKFDGMAIHAVTFDSNQFKSVDNKTPTADLDIRYQEREEDLSVADRNRMEILENKNKRLQKELADLEKAYSKAQDYARAEGVLAGQIEQGKKMAKEIDKKKEQIAEIKAKRDELLAKAKAEKAKAVEKVRKEARERLDRKIRDAKAQEIARLTLAKTTSEAQKKAIIEKYRTSIKNATEKRHGTDVRHKIRRVVNELNTLLVNQTKERHVPLELQKPVAAALDMLNLDDQRYYESRIRGLESKIAQAQSSSERHILEEQLHKITDQRESFKDKIDGLKKAYKAIETSADPYVSIAYNANIASMIDKVSEEIGDTLLRDMNNTQLNMVYDLYKGVLKTVRDANKLFAKEKAEGVIETGDKVIEEIKKNHKVIEEIGAKKLSRKKFWWNNLKPVYAFEKIGSPTLTKLFKNIRKGEDVWITDVTEAKNFFRTTANKYHFDSWKMDKTFEFKSNTGRSFKLNLQQMMSLYAYVKRDQSIKHLTDGGFVFDNNKTIQRKGKEYVVNTAQAYNISTETLGQIISKLSKEQMNFVDDMQNYLSEVMGAKGNEVSRAMYDIELFRESNYFPLKSAKQFMVDKNEVTNATKQLVNSGFTKPIQPGANNPIILSDFMDVWANHVNDMSMYHSFVMPIEDFNKVYNFQFGRGEDYNSTSVKQTVQDAFTKAANDYIEDLIKDINGGARVDPREGAYKQILGNWKKAAVFASASVVIQQPSAIGRALAEINLKYFLTPTKVSQFNHKKAWEQLKKYAPVAAIKEMGYFDADMGMSTVDFIQEKEYKGIFQKAKGFFTDKDYRDSAISFAPAMADEYTWCAIWDAVKRETKAKHKNMNANSEEFLKIAGERFSDVITKTQVYDSVLSRSANMRSHNIFMQMLTAFMAEPTTSANMAYDAMLELKAGNKKKAVAYISSVGTSVVLNSLLVSLVYAMRDDDEDERYHEKYLQSLTQELIDGINPLTYIPFIKDIWSIFQGWDVERVDMSLIADLYDNLDKTAKKTKELTEGIIDGSLSDEEIEAGFKELLKESALPVLDTIASMGGVPLKNVRRDIGGVINTFKTFANQKNLPYSDKFLWETIADNALDQLPFGHHFMEEKDQRLLEGMRSGNDDYMERIKKTYTSEESYLNAVRGTLKTYFLDGELGESQVKTYLMVYGDKDLDEADSFLKSWKFEKKWGFAWSERADAYYGGQIGYKTLEKAIMDYTGKTEAEAVEARKALDFRKTHPDTSLSDSQITSYYEFCEPYDIPEDVYYGFLEDTKGISADIDSKGESIPYSKTKKIMPYINDLPLTAKQKTAVAKSFGWADSTIAKYKLW